MGVLGIDVGRKKIGIAYSSEGILAAPVETVVYTSAYTFIENFVQREDVSRIIVGLPEGRMQEFVKAFAQKLRLRTGKEVILYDETLTSQHAQAQLKIQGGSRKNRTLQEDAVAAAHILQAYLEETHGS